MDWFRPIDAYCERSGPGFWGEPLNAVTNALFVIVAVIMWHRARRAREPFAQCLAVILAAIGTGSFLFHTYAQVWAALADTLPILLFVLVYLFAVNHRVLMLRKWPALTVTTLFLPFAAATIPLFRQVPGLGASAVYAPVPLLIAIYAAGLWPRNRPMARGLLVGALILVVSITFRSLDIALCDLWPPGTHFLWHILNALMLGWMIEVYLRDRLATSSTRR